ncbi:MAG: helix-turn-helix transcriptional regulator [Clostridia bacterium]|nr:helix-turn-helix transcriptional regulator [Clostridia bacterium]MBD5561074.1 helix-turn-helix transcriptional regulator [Clostridia bacterium]
MTPKQYLSNLRIRKAKELLTETNDPVCIVASSVGFADPLAFSKFFRRIVGIPPTEYRLQRRQQT